MFHANSWGISFSGEEWVRARLLCSLQPSTRPPPAALWLRRHLELLLSAQHGTRSSILAADMIGHVRRGASASCGWGATCGPCCSCIHVWIVMLLPHTVLCCAVLCCVVDVCGCRAHGWCAHGAAGSLPGWRKHLRPHGHLQGHHQHRWGAGNTSVALTHARLCWGAVCSTRLWGVVRHTWIWDQVVGASWVWLL